MLNRPTAAHAELQDPSLEVKAARRKWNPALHPRDSKGRFIETGGTVRLWGGQLARVLRALPNDRVLVQDQTAPNEFDGRRHTTSAKWVTMVARPDGTAPTDNEDKVESEDEKRDKDPARGNGVVHDDAGDPTTPNEPHHVDDRGRPIGEDDHPVGPRENDDQDEPADGKHPINVRALPNQVHGAGGRFPDTAAVRQHFLTLADQPGQKPQMAQFLRSVAGDEDLRTTYDGRLAILRDDSTGRWYLTATGTGQRMDLAGDFATPEEASKFAAHLNRTAPTKGAQVRAFSGFDFSNPDLDEAASTWRSDRGENIQTAIKRARQEFDEEQNTPQAPSAHANTPQPNAPADHGPSGEPLRHNWDDPDGLVTLTMPAALADFLNVEETAAMEDPDTRKALTEAKKGPNGTLKVTAPIETHRALLEWAWTLAGGEGLDSDPKEVRAYNNYTKRVDEAAVKLRRARAEKHTGAPNASVPDAGSGAGGADAPSTNAPETGDQQHAPDAGGAPGLDWDGYDPSPHQHVDEHTRRITQYRTPEGVTRDIGGRFGVGQPVRDQHGNSWTVISENPDGTINVRKNPFDVNAPLLQSHAFRPDELRSEDGYQPWRLPQARAAAAEEAAKREDTPDTVTMSPDEVSQQLDAVRPEGSKAPSSMDDGEIRDEIVSLMEREMANGGELSGVDRTRLQVLEAEEARRAGRAPKREDKPKPQPAEEPGGLFDVAPDEQQRFVADPNNPDDLADDAAGTPDMFADHEGRDTRRLRAPQSRKPADFQVGDRFVDNDGRTYTVKEPPLRTPRGRIRVVDDNGGEHFLAPDKELRVLHPDEDAPEVPEANAPDANAPEGEAPSSDTPDTETSAADGPQADTPTPNAADTTPNADAAPDAEPAAAPGDHVRIDHSGTGTTVHFPTPNGMVSDEEFGVLRRLGFKASRDRTQPRFFYLPSNMTLSRRDDKVKQLKEWLERRNVAFQMPNEDPDEKPELSDEQLQQLRRRYHAPAGTWATTDFQPGDEVWTGSNWYRVDSVGPKNLRLQSWGATPYDRVLARRRGGEIRTMFDAPTDDSTPRPGTDDPKTMRDEQITAELAHLRDATLPDGNDPSARAVRRQVTARIRALNDAQSERTFARRRDEMGRRDQTGLVRDPARLARLKGEQVQGRDGALIGAVYKDTKGKWVFVDRDGRTPTTERYTSRAAAITALNKLTDNRNQRAGEGWKHSAWDDVQPGDTIRVPELGRPEGARGRTVTGWSEPLEVSEIHRGDMGQVLITGRRDGKDVQLEVPRTDATFGASKPGTVSDRGRGEGGGGMDWQQMRPDDFGQDERPAPAPDQNAPRPTDEFGTPDLIDNGTPDTPQASPDSTQTPDTPQAPETPGASANDDETETARALRDELPELPALPKLSGLSRQDKDSVRRIRDDYAQIRASLDGILDGNPPTGDAREDLRRVREQLDYVASRLNRDLLPDSDEARTAQRKLYDLGQDLDRALAALPEREPQPQGDGPDGGTLFHPWDLQDGDLVSFQANDRVNSGLAPFYGTFRGASSTSNGRTLVSYEGREWNEDRQRWENRGIQHTVVMPQGGLVERFTPEQWDAWRRPNAADNGDGADAPGAEIPPAPIGDTPPVAMSNEDIAKELDDLEAWRQRHIVPGGEGPRVPKSDRFPTVSRIGNRRGALMDQQRIREAMRRREEQDAEKARQKAEALERAQVGKRNADGSYPVSLDGEQIGMVEKLGSKWKYTHTDGTSSGALIKTKSDAVAGLVHLVDIRREQDEHRAKQEERRARQEAEAAANAQPNHGPAYSNELRVRMADIGDDIATLRNLGGLQDPERIQRLQELIRRVEDGHTDDLQGDLRHIRDEAAWLEAQFNNPDLPYETRSRKSWAVAARRKAEAAIAHPDFQGDSDTPDGPDSAPEPNQPNNDDRTTRAQAAFGEGMNAVGGESLPEMQELRDRLDRANTADDPDSELRDIADRMDGLADQYELAGPQGEHAAEQFRRAARIARGEDDGTNDNSGPDADTADAPAAPNAAPPRFTSVDQIRDLWRSGELDEPSHPSAVPEERFRDHYADNRNLQLSEGGHLAIVGGDDIGASWTVMAPGSMEPVARAFTREDALAYARILEGVRDENGRPFPWDAPDAAERARTFRGPNGESLGETVAQRIVDRGDAEGLNKPWQDDARLYLDRERRLDDHYDAWRAQQEADGYTVPLDVRDAQAGDEISALDQDDRVSQRGRLRGPLRAQHMNRTGTWPFTNGTDYSADLEDRTVEVNPDHPDPEKRERETPFSTFGFRNTPDRPTAFRRPRPGEEERNSDQGQHSDGDTSLDAPDLGSEGDRGNHDNEGENTGPGSSDSNANDPSVDEPGEDTPNRDDDQQNDGQDDEENHRQRNDANPDGGANGPDSAPDGGPDASDAGTGDSNDGEGNGPDHTDDGEGDGPDHTDDQQDTPNAEEEDQNDEERRRRRRRRNRNGGNGAPNGGGLGGPGLPHLNLPDSNTPAGTGTGDGDGGDGGGHGGSHHGSTPNSPRPRDVDSLRNAWRTGQGLTADEDTPERRAHLADLANREGLALSPEGGIALYPEQQADGSTVWHFAQARNGTNLPGITLQSNDPEEARTLAGRFEEITDRNGDPFDWHQPQGPAAVMAWRDGEGRSLPQALRDVQNDYEQERAGGFNLPEDLTGLDDSDLESALRQGLGPEDMQRVMAEMDRRDGYVDQRIRAAVPDTPPADADEAERRGQAMDEALGFGDTDVTQPAPATPGRLRREFNSLDEERFQAAMQATGGRMLSPEAEAAGIDPRDVFSGGKYSNKRARELASPELNHWMFGDDNTTGNGRLTYPQYRAREADRTLRAEFADWDEARYQAAIAATNGYFYRREYKYGGPGFNERDLFSGGALSANDRWRQFASEELQEWFDNNGGRQTFAQFKQSRRDSDRLARHQHEEEMRRAAEEGAPNDTTPEGMPGSADSPTVDDVTPAPPASMTGESEEEAAFRFGGHDRMKQFANMAEVRPDEIAQGESVWLNGQRIGTIVNLNRSNPDRGPVWKARPFFGLDDSQQSRSQSRDTALANLVVRALQDGPTDAANPNADVWDSVTWRLASVTRQLPELPESLRNDPEARARYERLSNLVDAFGEQHSPTGDLRQDLAQARDDFAWLHDAVSNSKRNSQQRQELSDLDSRTYWAGQLLDALGGPDSDVERPRAQDEPTGNTNAPSPAVPKPDEPVNVPEDTARPSAEPQPGPEPEPIGGQPAHWARVEDLAPGDMVRMDGTTKGGRQVQRAGYVQTAPVRVDVTRRGRAVQEWRTWVTENPDGTGAAGNVYTSINANAARAEAPDDVVPGSPASGAQASLRSGELPDQIPTDRSGRGLFPGSTVTGTDDREGTVTGATDSTVSVHWADGNDDAALSPTTLTVTDGQRPDGWTTDGHRVTPRNIVSDTDGALLGPVDDVDGDSVRINTADGTITRSAGELRVTGEVRDEAPATSPVTNIDEPAAGDLKDGDVILLDLDGHLATVAITSPPHRDGDRVTIQYADTTTGEMGEIDVDARAVLPRAQGPDGGAPDLGPDNAPEPADDLVVHEPPHRVDPITGPTVDPGLTPDERNVIGDHADGPDDNPDAHQGAVRISANLPLSPEHARALADQLRASADPSTPEGRSALRAADRLDRAAGFTPPPGFNQPRPMNVSQIGEGDYVAMPDARRGDQIHVYRVIDVEEAPGGMRGLLLEDENNQWRRRTMPGITTVWQLPEAAPDPVSPPDIDDTDAPDAPNAPDAPSAPAAPSTPDTSSTPDEPATPVARVRPGSLRRGDVIDAPVSRTGYQFNGHRRLTIISEPQRNGWWMQLTGVDENGNVHDFGLHSGRAVDVYDRNRPTPALPPVGTPRDPNQVPQADIDQIVNDHGRAHAARIIDEAIAGTEPPGDIHALREQIAQRLTAEALANARQATRRDGSAALDAAGITGRDRADAQRRLRDTRDQAHNDTVRAALRTINDLEPLDGESNEDLAARARDLLRLIPDQVAGRPSTADPDADPDITRTVNGHADDAVNALLQQLQAAGVDPGDADRIARILTQRMAGTRQATARRIAARVAAASPDAGRQPGLLARIVAALIRMAKRFGEVVRQGAQAIAERYRDTRERLARLRAFLGRAVRRVRQWPESRRLARLHRAVNLPDTDGESLAARISHWAGLLPEPGRFGQAQRRVTFWRPTTWARLASGRLPDRSDRIQWAPDRAADGGPGLTGLRHMAALRAAGTDVDQDVTRRLSTALGDDFGNDPHATLQHADDYVAASERRLVNLQAARSSATIPDDPDLDIEITAARAELAAARRDYADLRSRYAAAVPDAVAASLADVRPMGPEGNTAIVFGPDTTPDAERAARGVQRLIPRSWLNTPEVRRVTAVDGTQGRYEPEGQRITVADLADEGLGTAGFALAQHFAQHLGDLDAAQRAFWFTRTHIGQPGARRMRPRTWDRLLRRQQTQPDTGDTLARSVQSMFNGDWYLDDDLRAFLLGLLATR